LLRIDATRYYNGLDNVLGRRRHLRNHKWPRYNPVNMWKGNSQSRNCSCHMSLSHMAVFHHSNIVGKRKYFPDNHEGMSCNFPHRSPYFCNLLFLGSLNNRRHRNLQDRILYGMVVATCCRSLRIHRRFPGNPVGRFRNYRLEGSLRVVQDLRIP